jgi:hypothetical protein
MRRFVIALALILFASVSFASGWKKSYFGATKPGSWARYQDQAKGGPPSTSTYTRLPDENGFVRIAIRNDAGEGSGASNSEYTLAKGFPLDRELVDFNPAVTKAMWSMNDEPLAPMAPRVLAMMKTAAPLGASVTFKGTETVLGKSCDRYGFTMKTPGDKDVASVETGDVWVSDAVPFGLVKQTIVSKYSATGKTKYELEKTLIGSGFKDSPGVVAAAAAAAKPVTPSKMTVKEAFDKEAISINATVDPAKNGERVHLVITNTSEQPLTLVVPKGKTTLHVGIPLDDFNFESSKSQTFELPAGETASVDVTQTGKYRALKGTFEITVFEGTPLFSGSATVGWVK